MPKTLLLTSFCTWMPHQPSNSSDDLLAALLRQQPSPSYHFLRQLPVDFQQAPALAIAHLHQLQPDGVIACGMAEDRTHLSLESTGRGVGATGDAEERVTGIDLEQLVSGLTMTVISRDAGQFVCNALYHALLQACEQTNPPTTCLFVHVPRLTAANLKPILADFQTILDKIASA